MSTKLDLWLARPEAMNAETLHQVCGLILSPEEWRRHERFVSDELKHNFLMTRYLVRTALSVWVREQVAPQDWAFAANAYGRPYVTHPGNSSRIRFNVAHAPGLIGCLIGEGLTLGLDIENTNRHVDYMDMARSCFSHAEYVSLLALSGDDLRRRFFEYWTLKESYIKARGMGLSLPLDAFTFRFRDGIALECGAAAGDSEEGWKFHLFRPTGAHQLAVSWRESEGASRIDTIWLEQSA